jgi:hypothetical protein
MFDHSHYVPVLRWRMAEWCALKDLNTTIKQKLTPIIELLPKDFEVKKNSRKKKSIAQIVDNKVNEIFDYWGEAPFFIDFRYVNDLHTKEDTLIQVEFAHKAKIKGLNPIPVIELAMNNNMNLIMNSVSKILKSGICIRIQSQILHDTLFQRKLANAVSLYNFPPEEIDMVFDNQIHSSNAVGMKETVAQLPNLSKWRTLCLIGGSFPIDLSNFSVGEHELQRDDYLHWLAQVQMKSSNRLPTFGDYTVQHPFIRELAKFPNLSVSIRYTSKKHWVIMRGQGVRNPNGSGYSQWPANAAMLCLRNEFVGRDFSKGDEYIYDMGEQSETTGNATTWIRASINHHLTFVVKQLANLFGS